MANLGFERALEGWTPVAAGVLAEAWTAGPEPSAPEGFNVLKFVGDTRLEDAEGAEPQWVRIWLDDVIPVTPETVVSLGTRVRVRQTLNEVGGALSPYPTYGRLGIEWRGEGGALVGEQPGVDQNGQTFGVWTNWHWIGMVATAPVGAASFRVFLETKGPAGEETMFDAVSIRVGDEPYGVEPSPVPTSDPLPTDPNAPPGTPPGTPVDPTTGVPVPPSAAALNFEATWLPKQGEGMVDRNGTPTRSYYTWFNGVDTGLSNAIEKAERALAIAQAIPPALGSPGGTVRDIPPIPAAPRFLSAQSVRVQGSGGVYTITLDGDVAQPSPMTFFGGGPSGERGFHAIADAFTAGEGVDLATDPATGVTDVALAGIDDTGVGAALVKITRDAYGRVAGTEAATTDDLPEGTRLYYTQARADARVAAGIADLQGQPDPFPQYLTEAEGDARYGATSASPYNRIDPNGDIRVAADGSLRITS